MTTAISFTGQNDTGSRARALILYSEKLVLSLECKGHYWEKELRFPENLKVLQLQIKETHGLAVGNANRLLQALSKKEKKRLKTICELK